MAPGDSSGARRVAFHPAGAPVPEEGRSARLLLRPLRVSDVERDYDAVMSSAAELRRWSQSGWPADDFTLEENRADLERHEREHLERVAFTYTVLDPAAERCLGCVYIKALESWMAGLVPGAAHAGSVGFWVRTSELAGNLDRHLLLTLGRWFQSEWAFDCLLFLVSQREERQATLLGEAGLELRAERALDDGRLVRVFG